MLREAFIQERVVRLQQIEDAAIFAQDAFEEEFRFLAKGLAQVVIEVGKESQIGRERFEIAQVEPLLGKIADQASRARVRQHPPHLFLEHARVCEVRRDSAASSSSSSGMLLQRKNERRMPGPDR